MVYYNPLIMFFCVNIPCEWIDVFSSLTKVVLCWTPVKWVGLGGTLSIKKIKDLCCHNFSLDGGFKYFLFSSLFGEMIQFDEHIFQMG